MTDIIVRETTDDVELGERAHLNYGGILEAKGQVGRDFLVLGRLLKENRDKRYFKALGYDTFEDFLGSPDIAMSRSMVFDLIRAVEVFIDKLARPMDELAPIGISKLTTIAKDDRTGKPLVYQDVEEWMGKAKELSRSDLQEEAEPFLPARVRRSDAPRTTDWHPIAPGQRYLDYVRDVPCIICGKHATEGAKSNAAHFPVSRGAGAPKDWVVPMCGECHAEHHRDPVKFLVTYQQKWAAWFFRTLKMYDDALKTAEETLATYATRETESVASVVDGSVVEDDLALQDATPATDEMVPPQVPPTLHPPLPSPLPEDEEKIKSLPEGSDSGSGSGPAGGLVEDSAVLVTPPPSSTPEEPKQIWPPVGGFDRCYACHHVLPASDLEGGLCEACRPSPVKPSAMPWTSMEVADGAAMDAPAAPSGLAFPKPSTAKRRAKKGVSK